MAKRGKILIVTLCVLLIAVSVAGCDNIGKAGKKDKDTSEFKRGPEGLVMSFVPNYPQDKFIVSKPKEGEGGEPIAVLIEVRNKGTYPPKDTLTLKEYAIKESNDANYVNVYLKEYGEKLDPPKSHDEILELYYGENYQNHLKENIDDLGFGEGKIHLSGFDINIIQMKENSKSLADLYLPAASSVNPLGGLDTAEFDGKIVADNILIDSYNPTILVTACYPYFTKSTPTVCIDPEPFDTRQEKVCAIGSQTVPNQGAPVAVTRIDQEAAAGKIQFKISIKNVGNGDVIWDKAGISKLVPLLERCNPNQGGRLDRKDFDRVQLEKVKIGDKNLFADGKCAPFADGTNNIVRLFDGGGFIICTYDVPNTVQSAYTTPIDIELRYAYRSTISKPIQIKKLETIG